jgi:N-methylhydantoinase B/oxoprolinase/acetone carboxylase alpha subunit
LFDDGRTSFFVSNSLVQDHPNQSALSMADCPDGLFMSQSCHTAAIDKLEDAAFGLYRRVGRLVEDAPHLPVALRRPVTVVHASTFLLAGTDADP